MNEKLFHFTRTAVEHVYIEADDVETARSEALRKGKWPVVTTPGPAKLVEVIDPEGDQLDPAELTDEEYKEIYGGL